MPASNTRIAFLSWLLVAQEKVTKQTELQDNLCSVHSPRSLHLRRDKVILRRFGLTRQSEFPRQGSGANRRTAADLNLKCFGTHFALAILADDQRELLCGDRKRDIFALARFQGHACEAHEGLARCGEQS